jgi:hypothetical protein
MFVRSLHPERLLRALHGTQPFLDYCKLRDIRFVQMPEAIMRLDDYLRWTDVLREMDHEKQLQIELELAKVNGRWDSVRVGRAIPVFAAGIPYGCAPASRRAADGTSLTDYLSMLYSDCQPAKCGRLT